MSFTALPSLLLQVLGPTDPADAPKDSLRGGILGEWEKLGLASAPNTVSALTPSLRAYTHNTPMRTYAQSLQHSPYSPRLSAPHHVCAALTGRTPHVALRHQGDNCVHASASPFEGLAERTNWLKGAYTIANDSFGKQLLAAGIPEATIKEWCVDPQVVIPGGGGKKGSLFDQVEDTDVEDCLAKCVEIFKAQPAAPAS